MEENEKKAKFFAQYYGQSVMSNGATNHESFYLSLTPLSQITDEDAIEVAKIYWNIPDANTDHVKKVIDTLVDKTGVADFLRSRGYLLPFRDLAADELISRGWVKSKEPKV